MKHDPLIYFCFVYSLIAFVASLVALFYSHKHEKPSRHKTREEIDEDIRRDGYSREGSHVIVGFSKPLSDDWKPPQDKEK